ncbi:hypothetical protein JCM21900_006381 [Sporobolomyces salmonicolor]
MPECLPPDVIRKCPDTPAHKALSCFEDGCATATTLIHCPFGGGLLLLPRCAASASAATRTKSASLGWRATLAGPFDPVQADAGIGAHDIRTACG